MYLAYEMLDNVDKLKTNEFAEKISSNFEYLFSKVKKLPLNEKVEENNILKSVEMILEFNRQQEEKGLKALIPNQMVSRLTISLAQLKAGNNSEKPKNEIRQLLYSLYRSKKLTKQLYKSLIDII